MGGGHHSICTVWLIANYYRDVIGRAITGSGKTLAFALPIIHTLSKR